MSRPSRRLPVENSAAPLTGYKLARLLLALDGSAVAFAGLSIGARRVYRPVDQAVCAHAPRHAPPHGRCSGGFYCLNTADAARAMAATATYRSGVLLDVSAFGRFIRYEQGLRYERQRVLALRVGLCACGRRADGFVDGGGGLVGWRRLLAECEVCARFKPQVSLARIGAMLPGIPVGRDDGVRPIDELPMPEVAAVEESADAKVALLSAEISLLQARLDTVQSRLESLGDTQPQPRAGAD